MHESVFPPHHVVLPAMTDVPAVAREGRIGGMAVGEEPPATPGRELNDDVMEEPTGRKCAGLVLTMVMGMEPPGWLAGEADRGRLLAPAVMGPASPLDARVLTSR